MSPALNESSAIRCFECGDAIKIRSRIIFNFYTGLPRIPCVSILHNQLTFYESHRYRSVNKLKEKDKCCCLDKERSSLVLVVPTNSLIRMI